MSGYMLAKISGQLGQMANQMRTPTGQPGVSVADYNDLLHRFNVVRESETSAVDKNKRLRDRIGLLDKSILEFESFALKVSKARDSFAAIAREAVDALRACENANELLKERVVSLEASLEQLKTRS